MVELKNVNKCFNQGTVNEISLFRNFNLIINDYDFVTIVGSNGSGKSTMLNLICGSSTCDSGCIIDNGVEISHEKEFKRHKRIGRVFQNPALGTCPNMTILENLSLADNKGKKYNLRRGTNKQRIQYYREQLACLNLGLEDKLYTKVSSLSGGQRQAMALLMSTMTPIDLLLLDEHTAALDPKTSEVIMKLTEKIVNEKRITTIMVTHNLQHAVDYGNRLIMMHKGEVVADKAGKDKEEMNVDKIFQMFNEISKQH